MNTFSNVENMYLTKSKKIFEKNFMKNLSPWCHSGFSEMMKFTE